MQAHTALVEINGPIGAGQDADADRISTSLRKAFEAENSKAVLLRINSPGGSPVQAGYMYDEIKRLRNLYPEKKIYSVIMDIGASAGYYVAAATDHIYANQASIVGSIGVIMPGFGMVETIEKLGMEDRTLSAGKNKELLNPFKPLNPEHVAHAKALLNGVHQQFIEAVKLGRGDRLKTNDTIFTGLFWSGKEALELGVIDGLGSAGFVAREIVGEANIVDYTTPHTFLDRLSRQMGTEMSKQFSSALNLRPLSLQ
jgi:protease-4